MSAGVARTAARAAASGSIISADLEQLGEELHRLHGGVAPAQHFAVEQVPAHRRQRADAGAGLRFQQALGGERLHRLAYHRAADAELTLEIRLLGKRLVRTEVAAHDADAEFLHDLREQVAFAAGPARRVGGIDSGHIIS